MTFNYHCIGGVIDDLDKDFVDDVKKLLEIMPKAIKGTTPYSPATSLPTTV